MSSLNAAGLTYCEFDSSVFGYDCYKLSCEDEILDGDFLAKFSKNKDYFIDAKIEAFDVQKQVKLALMGFKKICVQPTLYKINQKSTSHSSATVSNRLKLSENLIESHSKNFVYDRFHQDVQIESSTADELMRRWIYNSLNGRKLVCYLGNNFCTFSVGNGQINIDLVSVLDKGLGVASQLISKVVDYGFNKNIRKTLVTTEIENQPARLLYEKNGFKYTSFKSVFHFHGTKCVQEG